MCGIAGIISRPGNTPSLELLAKMSRAIEHRGPDGNGEINWENVALAHRRLAIVELSSSGAQPMTLNDRYSVVYNGEIYNHIELRIELEAHGHNFSSKSDTEVLLHAWSEWGIDCLSRFNGMWAFAILDKQERKMWLSRDRFGVKPLYTLINDKGFFFSSEIRPLLEQLNKIESNPEAVVDFVMDGLTDHTNKTFFKEITQLEASHCLEVDTQTLEIFKHRYYTPAKGRRGDLAKSLQQSVKLRMRSDVKVGTCLSGGLDSSVIASLASVENTSGNNRINAVHATTGEVATDESYFAKLVASKGSIEISVIQPSINDYVSALEKVLDVQQEPFGSPSIVMQYFVMEEANRLGCKVMLDGQAADEILLGYPSYLGPSIVAAFIGGEFIPALKLGCIHMRTSLAFIAKVFFGKKHPLTATSFNSKRVCLKSSLYEFHIQEIYSRHLPALLRYEDRNSMFHGVEARLPFMDYNVVEIALGLSLKEKITGKWQKMKLRQVSENLLPKEVCWRKDKLGFISPINSIMKSLGPDVANTINSSSLIAKNFQKVDTTKLPIDYQWRLYCVAKWEKAFRLEA